MCTSAISLLYVSFILSLFVVTRTGSTSSASGDFYTIWGRKTCPYSSKLVYGGQMTGPSWLSFGGGANYQCLPNNPEYTHYAPRASHSSLRTAQYRFGPHFDHLIPCAVCETQAATSKLMIPAQTKCPSSGWTLEYRGNLVSTAEYEAHSEAFQKDHYFRSSYVCIDERPESLNGGSYGRDGTQVYLVTAACGEKVSGALHNCPPYQKNTALACVVCSK